MTMVGQSKKKDWLGLADPLRRSISDHVHTRVK